MQDYILLAIYQYDNDSIAYAQVQVGREEEQIMTFIYNLILINKEILHLLFLNQDRNRKNALHFLSIAEYH